MNELTEEAWAAHAEQVKAVFSPTEAAAILCVHRIRFDEAAAEADALRAKQEKEVGHA